MFFLRPLKWLSKAFIMHYKAFARAFESPSKWMFEEVHSMNIQRSTSCQNNPKSSAKQIGGMSKII